MKDSFDGRLFYILPGLAIPPSATSASLGSKAYGLSRLAQLGLPVPPAFVLGTPVCREYFERGGQLPEDIPELLATGLARLETVTGRKFGGSRHPLLVSVRSGAPVSMPGMMDTLLNIGLCDSTLGGLLRSSGNPRLVQDCFRRLVRDFTVVVHGAPPESFDALVRRQCEIQGVATARDLDSASLARAAQDSLETALGLVGQPFPQSPLEQLRQAVEAVFRSWNGEKARHYRRINHIPDEIGTAVTIQAMAYGNSGGTSGSGVGFTRDPSTGENQLYLDFLFNAQGEDVVSGRHTVGDTKSLPTRLPSVSKELHRLKSVLEAEFLDAQDFEFTVESGKLYLLQTRSAKRTPWAALRIAVDMVHEELITAAEAVDRLRELRLDQIERLSLGDAAHTKPLASAIPAGMGVATGCVVFNTRRATELRAQGQPVILVRPDIYTDDIEGIAAAAGVLTASGGRTSHAAVVARQLGKVCLVGCTDLHLHGEPTECEIGGAQVREGDELTLDGNNGNIYRGRMEIVRERPDAELAELARWRATPIGSK
jgi:pyruvate, orthophosphate dikinase